MSQSESWGLMTDDEVVRWHPVTSDVTGALCLSGREYVGTSCYEVATGTILSVGRNGNIVVSLVVCRSVHIGVPCLSIYDETYLPVISGVSMDQDASRQGSGRRRNIDDSPGNTRYRGVDMILEAEAQSKGIDVSSL